MSQREHSRANQRAWSHKAYEAMLRLDGTPEEAAEKLRENPAYTLRDYLKFLGDVKGKKVANLLGSSGKKAVALSLLGARVTVVDIAEENQRYALECARAAGVSLDYIVSDVLEWSADPFMGCFDFVLMEFGILHYFVALNPLARLIYDILKPGGKLVLHEYHPINKKCAPKQDGDRLILEGDYFSEEVIEKPPPRSLAFTQEEVDTFPLCRYRYWQIGEIVSAVCTQNLIVEILVENPHGEFTSLPGTFTLVAKREY
jgi:SAM-dependent methyltransferase